jgi:hypothetical protein
MKDRVLNFADLTKRYEDKCVLVLAQCAFSTEMVGGQPAGEDGIRAFVTHHLKLTGADAENAVKRILNEEVGDRDVPSEGGELREKLAYSVNVVRSDKLGPYLGNWQIKACMKAAASRLKVFQQERGSKGDLAEMSTVAPYGISDLDGATHPQHVHLLDETGAAPARTYFQEFMGRVQSPQGSKSIVTDAQCIAPGSRFEFSLRYPPYRIDDETIADIFASMMIIGLGSAKSFEKGKFRIEKLTITEAVEKPRAKGAKKESVEDEAQVKSA